MRREHHDPNDAVPEGEPRFEYRREGVGAKSVIISTAALLLVIFILQNLDQTSVDFLFWDWNVAFALALGIAAVLGFVLGWGFIWLRRRARIRRGGRSDA
jgi:uncharacterized integral membrane protein